MIIIIIMRTLSTHHTNNQHFGMMHIVFFFVIKFLTVTHTRTSSLSLSRFKLTRLVCLMPTREIKMFFLCFVCFHLLSESTLFTSYTCTYICFSLCFMPCTFCQCVNDRNVLIFGFFFRFLWSQKCGCMVWLSNSYNFTAFFSFSSFCSFHASKKNGQFLDKNINVSKEM